MTELLQEIWKRIPAAKPEISEIVLNAISTHVFGSFAANVAGPSSDIDVFVIGERSTRYKSRDLDLIALKPLDAASARWRRSELYHHISYYAIELKNTGSELDEPIFDRFAEIRKRERMLRLLNALCQQWNELSEPYQTKYLIRLRREAQRLSLLMEGRAVAPTPLLDASATLPQSQTEISRVFENLISEVAGSRASVENILRKALDWKMQERMNISPSVENPFDSRSRS